MTPTELAIESLHADGRGVGLVGEDRWVVPRAVPGDLVRATPGKRRGRVVEAELLEVVRPSADRRFPPCPFDTACGGCDLSAMQAATRRSALAAAAARTMRLDAVPNVVAGPDGGYRGRIRLHLDGNRTGYHAARTHTLVDVDRCGVARPEVQEAHARLAAWLAEDPTRSAGLQSVELRSDGSSVAYAFFAQGPVPRLTRDALPSLGDVALDGRVISGNPTRWLPVLGLRLRASPGSFYQVNLDLNPRLVEHVRDRVLAARPERVLDLYAGIGNLGLPIAKAGVPVVAVEIDGQATADLEENARAASLPVTLRRLAAERFDPSREAFDVVVLDPPRAGAKPVMTRLLQNRPRRLVYVSCNPSATAEDLAVARRAGYQVTGSVAFDLFPDTHHIEVVVELARPSA